MPTQRIHGLFTDSGSPPCWLGSAAVVIALAPTGSPGYPWAFVCRGQPVGVRWIADPHENDATKCVGSSEDERQGDDPGERSDQAQQDAEQERNRSARASAVGHAGHATGASAVPLAEQPRHRP